MSEKDDLTGSCGFTITIGETSDAASSAKS